MKMMSKGADLESRGRIGENKTPPSPLPGIVVEPAIERVRVRLLPDGRMTRRDAARYLGVAVKTIAMWDLKDPNKLGGVKVGGRRFYYLVNLDRFIGEKATAG
jgi:hypothetical protein